MPGIFHTVTLPVSSARPRWLAWPAQDPDSLRTLTLDCTAWLADADTTIAAASMTQSADLTADGLVVVGGKTLTVHVMGGVAGQTAVVAFILTLASGDVEHINVAVPIRALVPSSPTVLASSDGFSVAGVLLTINGSTIIP